MPDRTHWTELRTGLLSAAAVLVAAVLVLVYGRVGSLHGKTIRIYATTDAARGVIRGTEVWLDGQKVGLVRGVSFRPPTVAPKDRLVLTMDIIDAVRAHVRLDTRVQVRGGATLIGDQVVYMQSGTAKAREVANGDTIHAQEQTDLEDLSSEAAIAARDFPPILQNVKLLAAQLRSTEGTLGALTLDQKGSALSRVEARTERVMARLSTGNGTLSLAMGSRSALVARASRAMAELDSVRALLASNEHSLGRFRRDSTLVRDLRRIRVDLDAARQLADSGNGTVARLQTDSALVQGVHRDLVALDSLFADLKQHPLRYIAF
ncbi:MAG TPA: MlaD family protein [Gemmatimonadaceae bacterium]|nr:MlaD family protein [Gemmatimonadaceae bacterium]